MNLIIDIGNTTTKLAVFQLDKIIEVQTISTKEVVMEVEKLLEKFSEIKHGSAVNGKNYGQFGGGDAPKVATHQNFRGFF